MTTQTQLRSNVEAELLADYLDMPYIGQHRSAAELRRQASVIKDLMDEVARLNQAVADAIAEEREACLREAEVAVALLNDPVAAIRSRSSEH